MNTLLNVPSSHAYYCPETLCRDLFSESYRPDPIQTVSDWADRFRILSQKEAEPGPYRVSRTPYLKEIMDCLSANSPITRVIVMKGAQLGFTDAGNNWIGYMIHRAPGRMISVMPRVEDAKKNSKSRIAPLIEECPALKNLVRDPKSRDSGNTILLKEFPGGELIMTGSNSAAGLRSTPARYLFLDEVDAYPGDVEGEGDPVALAEARTRTYRRKKIFIPSTPTIQGRSRIEFEFEQTDKRYYNVPCPECKFKQRLEFRREDGSFGLQWSDEKKNKAVYVCRNCGCMIGEEHKTKMLADGEWIPTAIGNKKTAGFHISSLYSPVGLGLSWTDIMEMWADAQKDPEKLKSFINTVLGEPWVEKGDAPGWRKLYDRREDYPIGTIPKGGLFLTAGIDIQKDRIEASIWAWGRAKESWLIEHRVIIGDTSRQEVWDATSNLIQESWEHENGPMMKLVKTAVDTGYATSEVYAWARNEGPDVIAIKGMARSSVLLGIASAVDINWKGKRFRRGIKLWPIGVGIAKSETYRYLGHDRPTDTELEEAGFPPGYIHLPKVDEEYLKQLTAESLVTRFKKGYRITEWQKDRERNEALDCRVYARAAATAYGIDRFNESHWLKLEAQFLSKELPSSKSSTLSIKKKQRISKSSYLSR